ncbi:MAG: hypothetical protein Q3965_06490 [Rothia sp. (in: high G+C Gram-positive bacteria)]|nr:hypothetical protein [Rothia sp. (in: high G+C Gram-positive bacteria)]
MADMDFLPLPDFETSEPKVLFSEDSVSARLAELGLDIDVFHQALNHGHNGAGRVTGAHSKIAAGTYRWHETLAAMRNELGERSWKQSDVKNAPRMVSPDGRISLMVVTGNAKTGTKKTPSNATTKGTMTQQDVWNNGESDQQQIEEVAQILASQQPVTWVLLYFYSREFNHLRAELSLPNAHGMTNGYITKWDERIILPKIEFGEQEYLLDAQPDTTPDIDFYIGNADAV